MIEIKNAKKVYTNKAEKKCAFEDINLEFNSAGLVVILGSSGCGKTSLLNCLSGLDSLTEGSITGIDKNDASFVFQDYQLIDDLSILDNLSLAINISEERIKSVLNDLNLGDIPLQKKIYDLSGGQKQRIAIARALLLDKKVLFADEPTGNLDEENSILVAQLLKQISKRKLVIIVSHNKDLFENIADQVIHLANGKIEEVKGKTYEIEDALLSSSEKLYLSFRMSLLISIKRIKKSLGRYIINTLLLLVIFSTFLLCLAFVSNDSYTSYSNSFKESNLNWVDFFPTDDSLMQFESISTIEEETKAFEKKVLVSRKLYNITKEKLFSNYFNSIYILDYFTSQEDTGKYEVSISSYLACKLIKETELTIENLIGMEIEICHAPCIISDIISTPIDYTEKNDSEEGKFYSYICCNTATFEHIKQYESIQARYLHIDCRMNSDTGYSITTLSVNLANETDNLSKNEVLVPATFLEEYYSGSPTDYIAKPIRVFFAEKCVEKEFIVKDFAENFTVSYEQYLELIDLDFNPYYGISIQNPTSSQIKALDKIHYLHFTSISSSLYDMTSFMSLITGILTIIFVSVFVILILFDLSLINNSISTKRREIGILKSMGLKVKSINKLLIGDNALSILIAFVLSLIALSIALVYINQTFVDRNMSPTTYLYFNYAYALFIILLMVILLGIYLGISYFKLSKKSDIELVYEK